MFERSEIVFLKKELGRKYPDDVYIGVGGGEFDEHRSSGRLQGTCAAMLVAQHLRVSRKLHELLSEIVYCDTHQKVSTTQLASLVKLAHRVKRGTDEYSTYLWAAAALDAIAFGKADQSIDLRALWSEFAQKAGVDQSEGIGKTVSDMVGRSFGGRRFVTELASIAMRMERNTLYRWLEETFSMMLRDAEMYLVAQEELRQMAYSFDVHTPIGIEPVCYVESDLEHIPKAMNSHLGGKMAVSIVRTSAGQTMIASGIDRLALEDMAAMVRMLEFRKRTDKTLSPRDAWGEGTLKTCPEWHLAFPTLLLNGSLSHPDVPSSRLTREDFEDIASHAFTAGGVKVWIDRYMGREVDIAAEIDLGEILDEGKRQIA